MPDDSKILTGYIYLTCTPDNNNNKKIVQRSKVKWYPIIITLKRCVFCQSFVDRCLPSFYYYFPFRLFLPPFFTTETHKNTNIFSEQLTLVVVVSYHSKPVVSNSLFHFSCSILVRMIDNWRIVLRYDMILYLKHCLYQSLDKVASDYVRCFFCIYMPTSTSRALILG